MDIKYELIPYDGFIGSKEFDFDKAIYDLNSQIELLSSQADNLDYVVAIASGIACGLLDILWVGEFDLTNGRSIASDKVDAFVKKTAEMFEGEKFDDVKSAVKALEKRFPIPSDGNTPDFGGGLQHHLRDFAHHPTIVGLAFSLLTQFTEKSYGTDVNGVFLVVDVPEKSKPFIGKDVPQKILMGRKIPLCNRQNCSLLYEKFSLMMNTMSSFLTACMSNIFRILLKSKRVLWNSD